MAKKHPGDDGDWCTEAPGRMSMKDRIDTQLGVTSEAVRKATAAEDAFIASLPAGGDVPKRFTDRRPPVDRNRLLP